MQEEVPLMVRTSSGLHSHSLRLAKQDSITSLQTKLRQQFRQSTPPAAFCPLLLPSAAAFSFLPSALCLLSYVIYQCLLLGPFCPLLPPAAEEAVPSAQVTAPVLALC